MLNTLSPTVQALIDAITFHIQPVLNPITRAAFIRV